MNLDLGPLVLLSQLTVHQQFKFGKITFFGGSLELSLLSWTQH